MDAKKQPIDGLTGEERQKLENWAKFTAATTPAESEEDTEIVQVHALWEDKVNAE